MVLNDLKFPDEPVLGSVLPERSRGKVCEESLGGYTWREKPLHGEAFEAKIQQGFCSYLPLGMAAQERRIVANV